MPVFSHTVHVHTVVARTPTGCCTQKHDLSSPKRWDKSSPCSQCICSWELPSERKTLSHHFTAKGVQVPKVRWFIHSGSARCAESQLAPGTLWSNSKRIKNRGLGSESQSRRVPTSRRNERFGVKQEFGDHTHLLLALSCSRLRSRERHDLRHSFKLRYGQQLAEPKFCRRFTWEKRGTGILSCCLPWSAQEEH